MDYTAAIPQMKLQLNVCAQKALVICANAESSLMRWFWRSKDLRIGMFSKLYILL